AVPAPSSQRAPTPPPGAPTHPPVDFHGVDVARALAQWGNPRGRVHRLGSHLVPALAAIGLTDLAAGSPHQLIHVIPHPLPVASSDPTTWWTPLTGMLGEKGQTALRAEVDRAGAGGAENVLGY